MNRDIVMARIAARVRATGLHRAADYICSRWKWYLKDRFKKAKIQTLRDQTSRKIAIFAIFQPAGMSDFCRRELLYLRKLGYDIVLSAPHPIAPADLDLVKAECRIVVERENFGRDFGSYRDAIISVGFDEFARYDRVLVLNDSIYFPLGNTSKFEYKFLNSTSDAIGLCENVEFSAHIGSFFIEFSSRLFCSEPSKKFWSNFRPLESRFHAIHVGEYGVSKVIYQNAKSIEILYSQDELVSEMLAGKVSLGKSWQELDQFIGNHFEDLKRTLAGLAGNSRVVQTIREAIIIDTFRKRLARSSVPHSMGLAMLVLFDAPFLKRDIYLRMSCDLAHVEAALSKVETPVIVDQIVLEMRRKGTRANQDLWPMFLNHLGMQ